ncbi:hypothetical protein B9479_001835 [Cryptococcus floricola]|uniref:RRM domain-containing protein n=1 Tax=Cryptococcus floricola TaxID=2591691 RepID=A0A5D3B192_9TREE|nr:hypothetical protein B9479_001835 [Cryptococcus floricola]
MSSQHPPNGAIPATKPNLITQGLPKIIFAGKTGRILCVADIRGDYHELNRLIKEHDATAVIHTGDFGFMTAESVDRMSDKILRHLIQYSPLLPPATRNQLLSIPPPAGRTALINQLNNSSVHFPLSQFPHLISGAINFPVPVFTTWGLVEDVKVIEKFRTGEYEVQNLAMLDEATSRLVEVGGVKLRLLGLGGTVAQHKLFDYGEGHGSIAGGQGTMWTTALQIGELIDTAQRSFSPDETRLFISTAPPSKDGLMKLVSNAVRADMTVSCGLHFRYPVSYNEFSVSPDFDCYRKKLQEAKDEFKGLFEQVREKVFSTLGDKQTALLHKTLSAIENVPLSDDGMWINTWHWSLCDVGFGNMVLSIADSRISSETKSSGANFSHRIGRGPAPPTGAAQTSTAPNPASAIKAIPSRSNQAGPGGPIRPPFNAGPGPVNGMAQGHGRLSSGPGGGPGGFQARPPHTVRGQRGNFGLPVAPNAANMSQSNMFSQARASAQAGGKTAAGVPFDTVKKEDVSTTPQKGDHKEEAKEKKDDEKPKTKGEKKADRKKEDKEKGRAAAQEKEKEQKDPKNDDKEANPWGSDKTASSPAAAPATVSTSTEQSKEPESSPWADDDSENKALEDKSPWEVDGDEKSKDGQQQDKGAFPDDSRPKRWSLLIKGLPSPASIEEVKGAFGEESGKITNVKFIIDPVTKKNRDFAYIDFASEEAMVAALEKSPTTLRDNPVIVSVAPAPKFTRGPFGGRGGFRGGRGFRRGGGSRGGSAGGGTA